MELISPPNKSAPDSEREVLEKIAEYFRIFAEPTRLAVLQVLKEGELSVGGLVSRLGTSQANISKQLKILYDAEIVYRERRGNQVIYSIRDQIVFPLCELVCESLNQRSKRLQDVDFSI